MATQPCACGGVAQTSAACGCDVCPVCHRHYTSSGNHRRAKLNDPRYVYYGCGCPVVTAPRARAATRRARHQAEREQRERAALAAWNAAQKGA